MRLGTLVTAICGLFWTFSSPANATIVQYSYKGLPFTVQSGAPSSVTNLSGWFRVNQAALFVPATSQNITSLLTAFSFTDGNQTLTNTSMPSFSFVLSFDSSYKIVSPWSVTIGDISGGPGLQTNSFTLSMCNDTTRGPDGYFATIQCFTGVDNAGTWSGPDLVLGGHAVPAPAPLTVLVPALLGLGLIRRYRA